MNQNELIFLKDCEELFLKNQDFLPESSNIENPKMQYHVLADGVFWEDEGFNEMDRNLSNVFRIVINYRTDLITNASKPNQLYQRVFELAKRYYPNWVGFKEERRVYNENLAKRIERIRKVSNWKMDKKINEANN